MHEAKTQLSRLVKAAQAGEEVIIAQNGVPAVRLQPITPLKAPSSLAQELSELRRLLQAEGLDELPLPTRTDRPNPFAEG
ncbi:MAG: type II toxin-antitoxin system Phd/YefM family antitoxin [Thiobacillaceae bacterium]